MTRRLFLGGLLALLAAGSLWAQQKGDEQQDPNRPRFQREQGSTAELKDRLGELLQALGSEQTDKAKELFAAMAPDEKVIADAFAPEAVEKVKPKLLEQSKALFAGEPAEIAKRLKLDPAYSDVTVFQATTEDLLSMEAETDAARHFAGGLRRGAQLLRPRVRFYAVLMRKPEAPELEGGIRLQIFVHFQGRYVLLGKVWKLDE